MILRALYYIGKIIKYNEEPDVVKITENLRGFYFSKPGLVLSAGRPLAFNGRKMWVDVMVYKPVSDDFLGIHKLKSVIEIKAYPQKGLEGIVEAVERLKTYMTNIENIIRNYR